MPPGVDLGDYGTMVLQAAELTGEFSKGMLYNLGNCMSVPSTEHLKPTARDCLFWAGERPFCLKGTLGPYSKAVHEVGQADPLLKRPLEVFDKAAANLDLLSEKHITEEDVESFREYVLRGAEVFHFLASGTGEPRPEDLVGVFLGVALTNNNQRLGRLHVVAFPKLFEEQVGREIVDYHLSNYAALGVQGEITLVISDSPDMGYTP